MATILEFRPANPAFSQNFAATLSTNHNRPRPQPAIASPSIDQSFEAYTLRESQGESQRESQSETLRETQSETQIAATVARNDRDIARLLSIDHLNRLQRLFTTAPTIRTAR
jgi:hypothetical protein